MNTVPFVIASTDLKKQEGHSVTSSLNDEPRRSRVPRFTPRCGVGTLGSSVGGLKCQMKFENADGC